MRVCVSGSRIAAARSLSRRTVFSKEDIGITRRLREVGELMGVRVLDYIIGGIFIVRNC
jgi:hypothetical protein